MTPWLPDDIAQFGPGALAALIIGGYLVVGEPFVGWVLHRRFEAAVQDTPGARRWLYRRILVLEWGLVILVAGVVLIAPEFNWSELGLRWPERVGPVTAGLGAIVLAATLFSVRALRNGLLRAESLDSATLRSVGSLLPRTRSERRLFAAVAVTAGVAEEVLYRGFAIALLIAIAPWMPWWAVLGLGGLTFGLAHAYQGVTGTVVTGLFGAILAAVYLESGSLLVPIALHVLIDARFLAVPADVLPEVPLESGRQQ